jgi:putative pyruvate formate lyase activating enzyme
MERVNITGCELCPRRCGVNREKDERGFCSAGPVAEVFRYGPHFGEEPPVSGTRGSGTVFFSRCTLKCIYCQNHPWSQEGAGDLYDSDRLMAVFRELADLGCHNWNLVSPTPWLPQIRAAVRRLAKDGLKLPIVYNTSGFEREEVLREYRDLAGIYLTDLRYAREESALDGSGFKGYVHVARQALKAMWEMTGPMKLDADGLAQSGTICRMLILPGRSEEVIENLRWLADNIGLEIPVSVMSQYLPAHQAKGRADGWGRRITQEEYGNVAAEVERLGFENGWVQELEGQVPDELVGYRMEEGSSKKQRVKA